MAYDFVEEVMNWVKPMVVHLLRLTEHLLRQMAESKNLNQYVLKY